MKPITLIGMMGSGKTTIGQQLAKQLNLPWVDTDVYIEQQEQRSISNIFQTDGEPYFRLCENKALKQLLQANTVLSTGGGIIINEENRQLLKEHAQVIYLKTSIPTLCTRIDATNRPLLENESLETKLTSLYQQRATFYESCAHFIIETDNFTVSEIVTQIKNLVTP